VNEDPYDLKELAQLPTDPLADYSIDDLLKAVRKRVEAGHENYRAFVAMTLRDLDNKDTGARGYWTGGVYTCVGLVKEFEHQALNGFPQGLANDSEEED
jgi:hypothetical protein